MQGSATRAHEIATRSALGAGRLRLLRQLLSENAILSLTAGSLGLLITYGSLGVLDRLSAADTGYSGLEPDRNVLLFTLGVSLLAPLFFGLIPALRSTRPDRRNPLGGFARGSIKRGAGHRPLVIGQVAIALTLMVVASFLAESLQRAASIDLGYDAQSVLTMRLELPETRYPEAHHQRAFFEEVLRSARDLPELDTVGLASRRPLADDSDVAAFDVRQLGTADGDRRPFAERVTVEPDYFRVMELGVVRGRMLTSQDSSSENQVGLINKEAARRFWGDLNPVGTHVRFGTDHDEPWIEIVGLVTDEKIPDPKSTVFPMVYRPVGRQNHLGMSLAVVPLHDRVAAISALRREIWAIDPEVPIADIRTMAEIRADDLGAVRVDAIVFSAFALFAMLMAAAGIYGIVALAVSQRTAELGLRMALGADPGSVRRLVVGSSMRLALIGVLLGTVGALVAARMLASGLGESSPVPVVGQLMTTLLLCGVAALAAWIPARRISRIDPANSLRGE